jgi:cAMP-dependent protein kinase regulator
VIEKSEEIKAQIIDRLSKAFMFEALDDKERDIVVMSMEERKVAAGDTVIQQGDDGAELFVVDNGTLDCYKQFAPEEEQKWLKEYVAGDAFGELALLYNAPRQATIKAKTDSVLWVLDRECFNHIVKDAAAKKRERYEEFLKKVELLEDMDPYERLTVSDAFKTASFEAGEYVIREGEWGDIFYILEEGEATATKTLTPGQPPEDVKSYVPGDYFGELALLRGEPRAANVVAKTKINCITLDRHSFKRLLGPLDDILKRNAVKYEQILKKD